MKKTLMCILTSGVFALVSFFAVSLFFVPNAFCVGSKPLTWEPVPLSTTATFEWKQKFAQGRCVDKNNTIVCGEVWYKAYSNGKTSCDFIGQNSLCRSCSAFRVSSCRNQTSGGNRFKGKKQ